METGIYVALSKEIGIFRDMEVTANDLANITTTGYSNENLLFKDYLLQGNKKEGKVAYTNDIATYRDTSQGELKATNSPLDVAIVGKGYFVVQTPLGTRYTRNGNFTINNTGDLVTSEGYSVLDESGQKVTFDTADRVIQIRDNGTINIDNTDRGQLKIVQFDNENLLSKVGNTLYKTDATAKPAENYTIASGMLENSNVKPVLAITHLMYVSNSINETNNYINTVHALARKASDTLAKVY
ncbi:MAG: flagellar hook-basal body complex protein [Pseudomonadota bacterium]